MIILKQDLIKRLWFSSHNFAQGLYNFCDNLFAILSFLINFIAAALLYSLWVVAQVFMRISEILFVSTEAIFEKLFASFE